MSVESGDPSKFKKRSPEILIGLGFGTAWMLVGAFSLSSTLRAAALGAIAALTLAIGIVAWFARAAAGTGTANRKILTWSIAGEIVGIFAGILVSNLLSRPDLVLPALALAVGLHFFPLAFAFRNRIFIATAAGICTVAVACLALQGQSRWLLLGFGAGACLWGTVLVNLILQQRSYFASTNPSA